MDWREYHFWSQISEPVPLWFVSKKLPLLCSAKHKGTHVINLVKTFNDTYFGSEGVPLFGRETTCCTNIRLIMFDGVPNWLVSFNTELIAHLFVLIFSCWHHCPTSRMCLLSLGTNRVGSCTYFASQSCGALLLSTKGRRASPHLATILPLIGS